MKAIVFHEQGGPEVLQLEERPVPDIGPGDILMKVRAVSVNRTLDIDARTWGATWSIPLPHILGADPAGEVAVVGSAVEDFQPSDRVVAGFIIGCENCEFCQQGLPNACPRRKLYGVHIDGGCAEYARVPARNLVRIPSTRSLARRSAN